MSSFSSIKQVPIGSFPWVILRIRGSNQRSQSQGLAQLVVMLLMLTILTTTIAMASRLTAGLFSQTLQSRLRLARDAAEYGLTITVHELNKPGNRLFLGTDWTSNGGTGWQTLYGDGTTPKYSTDVIPADVNQGKDLNRFPCYNYEEETPKNRIYRPTLQASKMHVAIQPPQYYSDNHQSFRLLGIQLYSADHVTKLPAAPKNDISYLALTMEGTYNAAVSSSNPDFTSNLAGIDFTKDTKYTIQQEYEVIPRCCSASFGTVNNVGYGTDVAGNPNNCPWNTQVVWMIRSITRTANFEGRT